jgi:phosphate transport system protein
MQRQLDSGLIELKQDLVAMAGYVELAIDSAIQAWRARNVEKTAQVYQIENKVNESHIAIDAVCLRLLATQNPLAGDLRLILAGIKINNDLERMVDQAVNIAKNTEYYLKDSPLIQLIDLSKMADEVKIMVRQVIDAFVKTNETLAHEVLRMDDQVDAFKNKVFLDVLDYVKKNPAAIEQGLNIILIARNLERIGDHATNIAEDVIFTISGKDIRHAPRQIKGEK